MELFCSDREGRQQGRFAFRGLPLRSKYLMTWKSLILCSKVTGTLSDLPHQLVSFAG